MKDDKDENDATGKVGIYLRIETADGDHVTVATSVGRARDAAFRALSVIGEIAALAMEGIADLPDETFNGYMEAVRHLVHERRESKRAAGEGEGA
jgi:hypothetical protein